MNRPGSEKSKADGQDEAARQLYGYLGLTYLLSLDLVWIRSSLTAT